MFEGMTLAELEALRATAQAALAKLAMGEKVAETRYGEIGRKFHPTSVADCRQFLSDVQTAIDRLNGCSSGGFGVVGF